MTVVKYEAPASIQTYLSTELNSLADGANKIGAAISNDAGTELDLYIMLELYLAATSSRDADNRVDVYLLPTVDGTNYAYGGDSQDPDPGTWVGQFVPIPSTTTACYMTISQIQIPPTDFKLLLMNEIGVAFASSGNTLKYKIYSLEAA